MKGKSDVTKKYQTLSALFFWLSIIVTVVPVIVYAGVGFYNGDIKEKITLGVTLIIAIILVVINLVFKFHIRSSIWIVIVGIYFCLDNIMPLLFMVAASTMLDEFLFTPLHKSYKSKAKINREIDKRLP